MPLQLHGTESAGEPDLALGSELRGCALWWARQVNEKEDKVSNARFTLLIIGVIIVPCVPFLIQAVKNDIKKAAAEKAAAAKAAAEKAAAAAEWKRQHPLAADISEIIGTAFVIAIVCCAAWWFYRRQNNQGFFPYSWTHKALHAEAPPRARVDVYLHRGFGF
jgi:hypothetical protein